MSFNRFIVLVFGILFYNNSKSQAVINQPDLNVLYAGLDNRICVAYEGVSKKNLIIHSPDYIILDSGGYYFVSIPPYNFNHSTIIYVGDKLAKKKAWLDSVEFRVRQLPKPEAMLGNLRSGTYPKVQIMASSFFLYANLSNFIVEGVKATIISYEFHIRDNNTLLFVSEKVKGNSAYPIHQYLKAITSGSELVIDHIKAELNGYLYDLEPLTFTIDKKYEVPANTIILFSSNGQTIAYNPNEEFEPQSFSYKRKIRIVGNDTLLLTEEWQNTNKLDSLKHYYDSFPGKLQIETRRVSDSSFYIRYLNSKGICMAEGISLDPLLSITLNTSFNGVRITYPKTVDSLRYLCSRNNLMPLGAWYFYHSNGALFAKGNFDINFTYINMQKKRKPSGFYIMVCGDDTLLFNYYGKWFFYNAKGELINEELYPIRY